MAGEGYLAAVLADSAYPFRYRCGVAWLLGQPDAAPSTLADFWAHAIAAWSPARLPPVKALPAPRMALAV